MTNAGESIGVLGCINTIISTYHEGAAAIQNLKTNGAPPPPPILDQVIEQAPHEIERERSRGQSRFGPAFDIGDHVAVIALQQITIQLQRTLLEKLSEATHNRNAGFSELVDAADLGRDRTIGVLLELRQRLMGASTSSPETTPRASRAVESGPQLPPSEAAERTPPPALEPESATKEDTTEDGSDARGVSTAETRPPQDDDTSDPKSAPTLDRQQSSVAQRNRHGSLLGFLRNVRDGSNSRRKDSEDDDNWPQSSPPSYLPFQFSRHKDSQASPPQPNRSTENPRFTYEEGDSAWSRPRGSQDSGRLPRTASVQLSPDEPATSSAPNSAKNSRTNSVVTVQASPPVRTPTMTTLTNPAASASTNGIRQPTPENNFLGFCKGAWKLQNGDRKAMQKSKEFNDGWSHSSVYCLTCTANKCAFAGHIAMDAIWSKVWQAEHLGLQFRWVFLAKSHVQQAKVRDQAYSYQCLFCALLGLPSPLFQGADPYLDHVSKEHRGRQLSVVLLYKTGCVADHVCAEEEDFDLNLFPLNTAEQADLDLKMREDKLAEEANATATARTSGDKQDSMFSEPSWNEGLSDFHYDEELEATEKEN